MGRQSKRSKFRINNKEPSRTRKTLVALRLEPKESILHKLNKPRTYTKFNGTEKATILLLVLFVGFFAVAGSYYEMNVVGTAANGDCPFNYFLINGTCKPDPWSTLWNGQIPTNINTPPVSTAPEFVGSVHNAFITNGAAQTVGSMAVQTGDFILFQAFFSSFDCGTGTEMSDSFSDSFTNAIICNPNNYQGYHGTYYVRNSTAGSTGTDTFTYNIGGAARAIYLDVAVYRYFSGWGTTASTADNFQIGSSTSRSTTTTITLASSNSWVNAASWLKWSNCATGCDMVWNSGQTEYQDCETPPDSCVVSAPALAFSYKINLTSSQATSSFNANDCGAGAYGCTNLGGLIELIPNAPTHSDGIGDCTAAYQCLNAHIASGNIVLNPNSTRPGIAISNSAVDLSTGASKTLGFAENFFTNVSMVSGQQFAWFLRANSTLPLTNWNPLHDNSVVLAVYAIVEATGTDVHGHDFAQIEYYVYIQRQAGQQLKFGTINPFSGSNTCPSSGTIFMCFKNGNVSEHDISGSRLADLALNFTGGVQGTTPGGSYLCNGTTGIVPYAPGLQTCNVGGAGNSQISISNTVMGLEFNFPWLSIQNSYYMGFAEMSGCLNYVCPGGTGAPDQITVVTSQGSNGDVISSFQPLGSTITDTGGFFGWVGRSIGGTFAAVGGAIGAIANPIVGFGNSLMSAIISGFAQSFGILLLAFQVTLNVIGNFFGWGNVGDTLLTLLTAIGVLIVNGFSAIVGFFTSIGALIGSGYFGFLAGAAILIGTLLPVAILLFQLIFNSAFTVTDILFFDYILGMVLVAKAVRNHQSSLKAFMGWISFNVFLFTFLFEASYAIFNIVVRPIRDVKQTVDPLG